MMSFEKMNKRELLKINNFLWEVSKKEYKEKYKFENIRDSLVYRKLHCKITADLSEDIFNEIYRINKWSLSKNELKNILYFSSLIHDIRKFDDKHALKGALWFKEKVPLLKAKYKDKNLFDDIDEYRTVAELIRYHKGSALKKIEDEKFMNDDIKILLIVLRFSDKFSKINIKSQFDIVDSKYIDVKINEVRMKLNFNLENVPVEEMTKYIRMLLINKYCKMI